MKIKLFVSGMSCMHCVKHVHMALSEIDGVTKATVDLDGNFAVVEMIKEIPNEIFIKAVDDAGYEVTKIETL